MNNINIRYNYDTGNWEKEIGHMFVPLEEGDSIKHTLITARQREAYKGLTQQRQSSEPFVFTVSKNGRFGAGLKFETLARLVMLATYTGWEQAPTGDNILCFGATSGLRSMTEDDMRSILKLRRMTFERFLNEVTTVPILDENGIIQGSFDSYLTKDKDGRFLVNSAAFFRGKKPKGLSAYRAYTESIRKLYNASSISDHQKLGKIFALIPYLNYEWNVLCHNPNEGEIEKVIPLNHKAICEILGLSKHNSGQAMTGLLNTLKRLTINIDGIEQAFCAFHSTVFEDAVTINPYLIYAGKHRQEVLTMAHMFIRPEDREKYPQYRAAFMKAS